MIKAINGIELNLLKYRSYWTGTEGRHIDVCTADGFSVTTLQLAFLT